MEPRVLCLMPTWNRGAIARTAVDCFRAQTYSDRVLCVIDDGEFLRDDAGWTGIARVIRTDWRVPTPMKWNMAISANPDCDIICFWDDDDWYHSERIATQVAALGDAAYTYTDSTKFYDVDRKRMYVHANVRPVNLSYMFRRGLWCTRRFRELGFSVDVPDFFADRASRGVALHNDELIVVRRNYRKTFAPSECPICLGRNPGPSAWHPLVDGADHFDGMRCRDCGYRLQLNNVSAGNLDAPPFIRLPDEDGWTP